MAAEGGTVAQNDELHAGTSDGYVHAAKVAQEANLSFVIAAHERDDDDVALLALKAIYGVDGDEAAEGLEELVLLDETAQQLYLGAIGRYDAHIEPFAQDALLSYDFEVSAKGEKGEFSLGGIGITI